MRSSKDMVKAAQAALHEPPKEPTRQLAVVTCMDARVDPWRILRASPGEIHVIRNAGGVITEDVLRSVVVSQIELGTTKVMVLMHIDGGMEGADEGSIGADLGVLLGSFETLEGELERGVQALRDSKLIQGTITGAIYDVRNDTVRTVPI